MVEEEEGHRADITVTILKGIRDGVRQTNERIDQTNERLDQTNERLERIDEHLGQRIDETNERLDTMREELSRRIVESEIRTSTAITALAGNVRDLTSVLREQHDLRPRVDQCERDIAELKRAVDAHGG